MAFMAVAAPYLMAASAAVGAAGQIQQGKEQKRAAQFEAMQLERQASQERAVSQREAEEERRRARVAQSRAIAAAAATGSTLDPGVINLIGEIEAQGDYNARSALYQGNDSATGREMSARERRREGSAAYRGGMMMAGSSLLSAASSFGTRR